jgi:hypothetical protein
MAGAAIRTGVNPAACRDLADGAPSASGAAWFASQVLVGQARGRDHRHRFFEASHVRFFLKVEAEALLIHVRRKVERFNGNIGAGQAALNGE